MENDSKNPEMSLLDEVSMMEVYGGTSDDIEDPSLTLNLGSCTTWGDCKNYCPIIIR